MDERVLSLFEQFTARATRVSAASALWLGSLALIWALGIVPKSIAVVELGIERQELVALERSEASRYTDARKAYVSNRDAATSVTFRLPGLGFSVPSVLAPVIWNWLCLLSVLYLLHSRSVLLNIACRAVRAHKDASGGSACPNLVGVPPWWLASLPCKDGDWVTAKELKEAVGWGTPQRRAVRYVVTLLSVLLLLQVHVASISYLMNQSFVGGNLIPSIAPAASLVAVVSTAYAIWRWFQLKRIPDNRGVEEEPNQISRREFHSAISAVTASVLVIPLIQLVKISIFEKQSRYLPRKSELPRATDLSPGFYRNPKSKAIHYVSRQGEIWLTKDAAETNYVAVQLDDLVQSDHLPEIPFTRATRVLEMEALALLQEDKTEVAIKLLLLAIRYDKTTSLTSAGRPSYRLYDLLAGLTIRERRMNEFKMLLTQAKGMTKGMKGDSGLRNRIVKWENPESAWRNRWNDRSTTIVWAGVVV